MIKTGIVGYGFASQTFHIPLIQATNSLKLQAIVSSKPNAVRADLPGVDIFPSAKALLEAKSVDLVIITAPNDAHFQLTKECLEQGHHVVLEKPMTCTTAEARELVACAKSNERILSVFHNRRWDGDFLTVSQLVQQNTLGKIRYFESHFDRFRPEVRKRWRELPGRGAGLWYDLGSHLIDQTLCLFGMPQNISARCLSQRSTKSAVDYFHVILHYPEMEAVLHGSLYAAGPNKRFYLEGEERTYVKFGLDPQEDHLKSGLSPADHKFGMESKEQYGTLYDASGETVIPTAKGDYLHYYEQLARSITGEAAVPVTAQDGSQVIRLLELAEKSSKLGKRLPVEK